MKNTSTRNKLGAVLSPVLGVGAAVTLLAFAGNALWKMRQPVATPSPLTQPQSITMTPMAAMGLIGLKSDALAIAGLDAAGTQRVMHDLTDYVAANGVQMGRELSAAMTSIQNAAKAKRVISAGQSDGTEQATLAAGTEAENRRTQWIASTFDAATASLTTEQKATLRRVQQNATKWELPAKYLNSDRSEAQWLALREALSHVRQAQAAGRQAEAAAVSLVADADADSATVAAETRLGTRLSEVQQALRTVAQNSR